MPAEPENELVAIDRSARLNRTVAPSRRSQESPPAADRLPIPGTHPPAWDGPANTLLTAFKATTYGVVGMEKPKDYYRILGVARDASAATIKRAYRRLAQKLHPEVPPGPGGETFSDLQAAYETLADADRRQRYDETLRTAEDRFSSLAWSFVRSPALGDLRRPVLPGSLSGEILLTANEARAGGVLPVDVPIEAACRDCDRTGGYLFDCPSCGGEGKVQQRLPVPVRIPAGVRDGTTFQVRVDEGALVSIFLTIHVHPR
jgi:hypothetical protein